MNRKQKIIVSITGIFLVLIILVGLTYAYFLTKITGNTNEKSISVTTANLEIKYEDNTDVIVGDRIEPGTTLPSKTFTVTNNGNSTVDYSVGLVNVINDFKYLDDVVYTLTCTSYNKDGFTLNEDGTVTGTENGTCDGVDKTTFPNLNSYIATNSIEVGKVHAYVITVTYKETGTDQSDDMNKTLEAKIDIFDPKSLTIKGNVTNSSDSDYIVIHSKEQESQILNGSYKFIGITPDEHKIIIKNRKTTATKETNLSVSKGTPSVSDAKIIYDDEKNVAAIDININNNTIVLDVKNISTSPQTLKDAIIKSAINASGNRTKFQEVPITSPGKDINNVTEKSLLKTQDDYGISYYYRGNVIDNYVNFAEMCFRIVRIQGDGSIKMILASELKCSETNVSKTSGYATDGEKGIQGSKLTASYGYKILDSNYLNDYIYSSDTTNNIRKKLNSWIEKKLINSKDKSLLKNDKWCIGDKTTTYDYSTYDLNVQKADELIKSGISFRYSARKRITHTQTPTLVCDGNAHKDNEIDENIVGLLTADEILFAGASTTSNSNYYLNDNATSNYWWALSLSGYNGSSNYDSAFVVVGDGKIDYYSIKYFAGTIRPVISLLPGVKILSGDGTIENAYEIISSNF